MSFVICVGMARFDQIDLAILRNLQKDGRMTNVSLADSVGISAPPCLRRIKIMEKSGIISSYHAVVNPEAVGFSIRALCIVVLNSQAPGVVESFLRTVQACEYIRACFSSSGNESFILSIIARNLRDYDYVIRHVLQSSGVVMNVSSYIILNTHKDEFGLPIEVL